MCQQQKRGGFSSSPGVVLVQHHLQHQHLQYQHLQPAGCPPCSGRVSRGRTPPGSADNAATQRADVSLFLWVLTDGRQDGRVVGRRLHRLSERLAVINTQENKQTDVSSLIYSWYVCTCVTVFFFFFFF